jgi:hypothetical protein
MMRLGCGGNDVADQLGLMDMILEIPNCGA